MGRYQAVVGCIPERSSFNAGLILARTLQRRGHRVSIVGAALPEFRAHVERHGLEFVGLGSPALQAQGAKAASAGNPVRAMVEWHRAFLQLTRDLDELAQRIRPDLAFLDVLGTHPGAYLLSELRIPTFLFHGGMLTARFSTRYPPAWSPLVVPPEPAASGPWWRLRCLAAWGQARCQRRLKLLGARKAWVPSVMQAYATWRVRRHAARHGWRFAYGDWGPQPRLPEIVLGQRAFDWPQLHTADRCYLSGGLAARSEYDGGWAQGLDDARALIYCVTSTMIRPADVFEPEGPPAVRKRARVLKGFLDAVVRIVAARADWQLVMACGPFARTFDAARLPANVRVLERAPQTEVLQRAALMITQAGAGAVREAVTFGVPMLMFPLWTDQFGNSARAVYHGVGARVDIGRLTSTELATTIDRLIGGPDVRAAVARLARACAADAADEEARLVEFIRRHAGLEI
jgi:UDP-N-acetylglucosamine:LPS N-acetylglucosamine transferase